jgi:hypothetical protein
MRNLRTILLSSVLALGLGQAAHAVYTQEDLTQLQSLVDAGDTAAILAFIEANPQLLVGMSPLAMELREFTESREGFFGGLFGPSLPDLAGIPQLPPGTTSETFFAANGDFLSGSLSDFGS